MRSLSFAIAGILSLLVIEIPAQSNTFPATGNVGIGTTTPEATLDVVQGGNLAGTGGSIAIGANSGQAPMFTIQSSLYNSGSAGDSGDVFFNIRSLGTAPLTTSMALLHTGNVGIGTTSPVATLDVVQGGNISGTGGSIAIGANSSEAPMFTIQSSLYNSGSAGDSGDVFFNIRSFGTAPLTTSMALLHTGNIGLGTANPTARLEVNGATKLDGPVTYSDGSVQSVAWNGILSGGDYAESVDVTGDRATYEPGDVLVIDPDKPGHFLKCTAPYSTAVSGIYSTNPGVRGRRQKSDPSRIEKEVPMAMIGVVPTKVTTENGPIRSGDILVTSSRAGYAMRGSDRTQLSGSIVGKAMDRLDVGAGIIEVLVSLQ